MGSLWAYRSPTHLRSNPLYTCMTKIILAAFLIAPAYLMPRLLSFVLQLFRFFFYKTRANYATRVTSVNWFVPVR